MHDQAAEMMLAKVLRVQEASPVLHVFVAQYVQSFRKNRHVELLHITRAEVRPLRSSCSSLMEGSPVLFVVRTPELETAFGCGVLRVSAPCSN
jgi:hypothetical protein